MFSKLMFAKRIRRRQNKQLCFETLEDRRVRNGLPVAVHDAQYSTAMNTPLVVSSSNDILENDDDPEGFTLTASIVTYPSFGTISNFNSTAGTFTYTPNSGASGIDMFTYFVNDGTSGGDSNIATVSIAVGGHFGPRTNRLCALLRL